MKWQEFETEVNELLGLRPTVVSGSKFYDKGDGVTPGPGDGWFSECKWTEKNSFTLNRIKLSDWTEHAASVGKRLLVPIRFQVPYVTSRNDYVLLSLHDFIETRGGGL